MLSVNIFYNSSLKNKKTWEIKKCVCIIYLLIFLQKY